jgi:two-component system, cell cycle sensor histidine kinase and response regulator CckA
MKRAHDDFNGQTICTAMLRVQQREWWLWSSAVLITLLLTLGLISFVIPVLHTAKVEVSNFEITPAARGLVGLVLLFDVYVVYQQLQIYRIRRRLLEREEVFRLITENAADMIAVVDSNGRRIYNSPAYERILGYSQAELRSTSSFDQIHPDDRTLVEEAAAHARASGVGRQIEYRMRDKGGNWHILESTASAIRGVDNQVQKLVIVNRDITDRRRLEEQFRQSQKMEAIGRLSGGIAHDFNNLLGVIIGYAEILQENADPAHPDRECLDEILRAGQRAASLTRQLLAFSRQQVLEPKIIDLNVVVADMEKMLRRVIGEDIELKTLLEPELARVKADQGQLEQVILNLAVNARDAMPDGGKLKVQTRNVIMDELDVRRYSYPFKPGNYVQLTVSDTGSGMDSSIQARVFEPFFTTKEKGKGTGLGLATVYGVVKQSEGYIELDSEVGKGTTFTIYLPSAEEIAMSQPGHADKITVFNGNGTILLVEDETALLILTRNMLKRFGYTVLEAANGAEACEVSARRNCRIDLLLTDVVMPGMNGRDLADRLANERPEMKVVYMSGYTGQGIGQGILPPGSCFLAKPFSRENLAMKIREALQKEPRCAVNAPSNGESIPIKEGQG